ncbi:MAG TPA: alpha/beta fold hydrolase [Actinomycetota bacterium]
MGRAHPRIVGAAMLVVGFALVAVLGGLVAKHLIAGPDPWSILGAAAGVAGLVLVVRGWQLLLGGLRRRWARVVLAVLGTVLVAQFVLLPVGVALDVVGRPKAEGSGVTPTGYEDVRFTTADGMEIAGWWRPGANGAAVIVLPGAGSTREDAADQADVLAGEGFGVLALDVRGHGQSGGPRMEFGWGAEQDVRAAVDWLEARDDVTGGVGVLGLSMGGEVALTAAALDPRIGAVVAEGATVRTWDDARRMPSPHPVGLANEWLLFGLVDLLASAEPPMPLEDAVAAIDAPVLLIMGSPDNERQLGPVYRDANPSRVTLWDLPDTPHIAAIRTHPDEYRERVAAQFAALVAD